MKKRNPTEVGGASCCGFLYVFTFASSHSRARVRDPITSVPSYFFQRWSKFSCLLSFWFTSRPNARAQRARENDAESTETWRVIDSGANERSRFVFSRSLLSRLASVRLLTLLFWFVLFSFSADNENRAARHTNTDRTKNNRCETYTTNPTCFLLLLLLVDVVIE